MSTGAVSSSGSTISVTGLASGLDTKSIINALLEVQQQPITHLVKQQERTVDQITAIQAIKTNLMALSFQVAEFRLPSLYLGHQAVSSSEPSRISATITSGAGVGGYEVEVKQLANSAQRTYTFTPPAAEETVTVAGREYTLKEGGAAKELASKINSDGKATVFAAVVGESIVLSSRTTGSGNLEAITASGGALEEVEGTAKEGKNAEFSVDGVAGTSSSNVVTTAIPGVQLTLQSLTSAGPVTIAVTPPVTEAKALETQINAFVTLYNSTVEAIQKELTTKPVANPVNAEEAAVGTLFGDRDLSSVLVKMRSIMYSPISGLTGELTSPLDVGISTGAVGGSNSGSSSSLLGLLKLDPAKLAAAVGANPEGVKQVLQKWSANLSEALGAVALPGGSLESRVNGDNATVREMKLRIQTMTEMLAVRRKALEQTYARLEGVISNNSATGNWLAEQSERLNTRKG